MKRKIQNVTCVKITDGIYCHWRGKDSLNSTQPISIGHFQACDIYAFDFVG